MKRDFSIAVDTPSERLDTFLAEKLDLSRTFIQEQIRSGNILINGKTIRKPSHSISVNDRVEGALQEEISLSVEPVPYSLDILYEDEELLCLNKPHGMVIHPASGHHGPTLVHYLLHYFKQLPDFKNLDPTRPGIVHRLDRGTSGVLLIAKNRRSHGLLSQLFKKREIRKEYEAVIWGRAPDRSHIENKIGRDPKDRKKMSSRSLEGRVAITHFSLLSSTHSFSHLSLIPETGRTHQLRVHLSELRLPIVGDPLYGPRSLKNRMERLNPVLRTAVEGIPFTLLHAKRLTFLHPFTDTELSIEAKRSSSFDMFLSLMKRFDT